MRKAKSAAELAAEAASSGPNLAQQALEARESGIADVCRALAAPEDLARLEQLRAEVSSKLSAARSCLSSGTQAQVEAARYGLQLLDKSHRHIAKLRTCIDKIDCLCAECTTLVEHHEKIRALSHAHRNVSQVLEELADIIDLPMRAAAVQELMAAGPGGLVAAFEGLTVLEGTANNIKEAWRRNARQRSDLGELAQYLTQVSDAMAAFERRLWGLARDYHALALQRPRLLVDVARVVEMQEQMDAHYAATKATYVRPKHFRERLLLEMEAAVTQRFAPLLALCNQHGRPNTQVKYDQAGNTVVSESRDYLGALTDVERRDPQGRRLPGATDAELAVMQIRSAEEFSEELWLETLLGGFTSLEAELAAAYDYVSPAFPPSFNIFDALHQMYHVQFAQAVDLVGRVSLLLSTAGQLQLMQWVCGYQQTLRGLGVQEELVRLPVAPLSDDPEGAPGFALLVDSYTDRMEATMVAWCRAILEQDLAGQPQQMSDGTLRTPGVIDFFRMLNEQVAVLEEISRGEVLLAAAARSLKLMRGFVKSQRELLRPPGAAAAAAAAGGGAKRPELGFDMVCALLNNSVDCYNQSLGFTEHVQTLLEEGCRSQLDVEDTCRCFLELAKAWARRLVDMMFSDAGLVQQWRRMYASADWLAGTSSGTILATIGDYFTDVTTFVEPGFCRRLCEAVLEELVRRASSAAVAAFDKGLAAAAVAMGAGGGAEGEAAVLSRLAHDERAVQMFFEAFVGRDKLVKRVGQLAALRELLDSREPEGIVLAYESVLELNPAITPAMVDKLLANRPGLTKPQLAEVAVQCKEMYSKALKRQQLELEQPGGASAAGAAGIGPPAAAVAAAAEASKGWKFWG